MKQTFAPIIICDRCGSQIGSGHGSLTALGPKLAIGAYDPKNYPTPLPADLCPICFESFRAWWEKK